MQLLPDIIRSMNDGGFIDLKMEDSAGKPIEMVLMNKGNNK